MLVRLMYASRATEVVDQDALIAILRRAKAHNPTIGVTGASASGFGHPECSALATQIGQQLPTTHPVSGPPAP